MRKQFDEQLAKIKEMLCDMCKTDAVAVKQANGALRVKDVAAARGVKAHERAADGFEADIERMCMTVIVKQQPVAHDLTFVTAAMKMVTDLERISDQAADIADITVRTAGRNFLLPPALAGLMETAENMVDRCARAIENDDAAQAKIICKTDDVADGLFERVKEDLTHAAADGEISLDLLMVAKYLEKICDHCVNVAEWVLFSVGERGWL